MRSPLLRFSLVFSWILFASAGHLLAAQQLSGLVVDETGRPLPRATIRILDSANRATAEVFTLPDGTFAAPAAADGCRVEASLTGFRTLTVPCGLKAPLVLSVAALEETIVVTTHRDETPVAQVAASVTVVTGDEIERRQRPPVADLLMTSPGVMVSRSGGYGSVASVFVRGGESNHNKVLLDGIPVNEPGGVFNFSNVTSENLERIEIVRGAHSALFGSDAMSSVIQMFTRRARPGDGTQFSGALEGGSYGTWRLQGAARGATGPFDYSVAAARFTTDNRDPNSGFTNNTVTATGGYELAQGASIRGVFRAEVGEAGTPGQTAFGRPDLDADFDRRDIVGGVTFLQQVSSAFRHRATYGLSTTRQTSVNRQLDPPYTPSFEGRVGAFEFFDFPYDTRNSLRRHYGTYQGDWTFGSSTSPVVHQTTGAVDWEGERGSLADVISGTATDVARDNFGLTLQHQASWARVFATAGVRFERNDSFGNSVAPRGSIAVIARRRAGSVGETRLKASGGRGIKEPTALQSFSASPFFLGNPDLEPEEAVSFEFGVEQRLLSERARLEATWFENRFTNIIATRTISFSPFASQYFNIGKTEARGLELAFAVVPLPNLEARGGYTWLDSEVTETETPDDPVFGVGRPLFRRPRHSGFIVLTSEAGRVSLTATGIFIGRRVDSDFSGLVPAMTVNPSRKTWDFDATVRLTSMLAATGSIHHLSGADYMEPLGYRALGRRAFLGLRVAASR